MYRQNPEGQELKMEQEKARIEEEANTGKRMTHSALTSAYCAQCTGSANRSKTHPYPQET